MGKRFAIAVNDNPFFGRRLRPGALYGTHTQRYGNRDKAVEFRWIVYDYKTVPVTVWFLPRNAHNWHRMTVPNKEGYWHYSERIWRGFFGELVRFIDKFGLYDVDKCADYGRSMPKKAEILANAPHERKVNTYDGVYPGKWGHAFCTNEGIDKHAWDTSGGTVGKNEWKTDRARRVYVAQHKGSSGYKTECEKYDIAKSQLK